MLPYLDKLLIDIVVRNHEVTFKHISLQQVAAGHSCNKKSYANNTETHRKWLYIACYQMEVQEAFRIVRHNGGLNVSGEYGFIEIDDQEFEADLV
jgi:hypothetical protein